MGLRAGDPIGLCCVEVHLSCAFLSQLRFVDPFRVLDWACVGGPGSWAVFGPPLAEGGSGLWLSDPYFWTCGLGSGFGVHLSCAFLSQLC